VAGTVVFRPARPERTIDRMTELIDSHVHFWDRELLDYAWLDDAPEVLARNNLPADYLAEEAAPTALVFVQADCRADQGVDEAAWIQDLAESGVPVLATVAHAPLEADSRGQLAALADLPLVSGIRRLLQDEAPGFALTPEFVAGVQSLATFSFSFDICIRSSQLAEATELVRRCPEIRFVLDHLGKPVVETPAFAQWADEIGALAELPNVWCKLSGLATEAGPAMRSSEAMRPWLRHVLEVFGPDRTMYGSDWPVQLASTTSGAWLQAVRDAVGDDSAARDAVFGATARSFYTPA
jgi:L-fuconolactonase